VPNLRVGDLRLAVDVLEADVSLRARLADLLQLDAGVHLRLDAVGLDIDDVRAELLLKVRLERLAEILDRTLTTVDRNPDMLKSLVDKVGSVGKQDDAAQKGNGQTEDTAKIVDRSGRDVGSIRARAEWSGQGVTSKAGEAGGQGTEGQGQQGESQQQGQGQGQQAEGQQQRQQGQGQPQQSEGQQEQQQGQGQQDEPSQPSPAETAAQASETLRRAGRDLWDAIAAVVAHQGQSSQQQK
jgi:hypothetical protein